ncbi:MAG: TIGR04283 family arsenosugar biosynthesis glycosyltransferase [Planctomycetes bacterium]|nr:TIGR04283 family arsenosugar biosynthesis glycosyltransferase [Planctomycetota bacterium]
MPRAQSFRIGAEHLIVFTRYPEPGTTKTRLIPALGAEGAAALQREMTAHTLLTAEQLRFARRASAEVRFAGGNVQRMTEMFGTDLQRLPQGDGELGVRMHRAIADAFARGAQRVVIIGTDCPSLDAAALDAALEALRTHDCVLGPARDGGYYLVGVRRPASELFDGIDWGTERVLRQTLEKAAAVELSVHQLPSRQDVDEPEDVTEWSGSRRTRLSVIIPTLNEAASIRATIEHALDAESVEVLVADGGSNDETCIIAAEAGARVLRAAAGRATQMNAGAAAARGEMLLFLHADTRLPPGYSAEVARMLAAPRVVLGAFRLGIDHPRPALRLVECGANLRSRLLGMPYGDQALCMRATDFYRLGGFANLPFMEDFELVRRVRRYGRVATARSMAQTSARRWLAHGVMRLTLIHQACILGYRLGIAPARMARWRDRDHREQVDDCIRMGDSHKPDRSPMTISGLQRLTDDVPADTACAESSLGR